MKFIKLSLLSIIIISFSNSYSTDLNDEYKIDISKTHEYQSKYSSDDVRNILLKRSLNNGVTYPYTEFGVHGMETPFVKYDSKDSKKQDDAFNLLSRAGVDSLRSTESAWHRIADKDGNPKNLNDLKYQLSEAKKYNLSHLFVVGYPPAKFTVANNKLSAVKPQFYKNYENYIYTLLKLFNGYNVRYLELGNEVDAPNVWWKKSTPQMYLNEMKILHSLTQHYYPQAKTVAFSATYSRTENMGGANGGRRFVEQAMNLGIDRYVDAYSLHHFRYYGEDDLPKYMHSLLTSRGISKPLLDTEQLDTSVTDFKDSIPYNLIKIYARGFFIYDLERIDYFLAKDAYLNGRLYSTGLFDINWNPKPRLLAYAMATDSMKGRRLIKVASPVAGIEAYLLANENPEIKYKYTILMWNNRNNTTKVSGLDNDSLLETWDLKKRKLNSDSLNVNAEPIAIYSNTLPKWNSVNKVIFSNQKANYKTVAPMPN